MRKFNYLLIAAALLCLGTAFSCSNKKKTREEQVEEFRSMLTANDTTQMLQMADNAMELLKSKKIDEVIASLYEYNDSTEELSQLTDDAKKRLTRRFKMFPVLSYNRQYYSFMLEGCNDVKYEVVFATPEQTGADSAKTMFMFNPIRINGEWKLCVKSAKDDHDVNFE